MYNPLRNKSHYSIQRGLPKPYQLAFRAYQVGAKAVSMTDLGSISGCVEFQTACKDTCKCGRPKKAHPNRECEKFDSINIKPILGTELYCFYNTVGLNLLFLAKNRQGWDKLIRIINESNVNQGLNLNNYVSDDNLIIIATPPEKLSEAEVELVNLRLREAKLLFGDNFYLGVTLNNLENEPQQQFITDTIRNIANECHIPVVALNNSYYCNPTDANDHRVLLCVGMKTTLTKSSVALVKATNEHLNQFFKSNRYYVPTQEEMEALYTKEEIENSIKIGDLCDSYDITNKPMFPSFDCPDGMSPDEYLRHLCRLGWIKKIKSKIPVEKHQEYAERVKHELAVFEEFGLATYFLVVADYVNWAKDQGILVGCARGSVGGCLTAYLTSITELDPIPYGLIFSRFLNKGRLSKDRISPPDIDVDFPREYRDKVAQYVTDKYGKDKVAKILTFGTMKGRSAISDVLSVHEACGFDEIKQITKAIPDEAKISDDLQEMIEEEGEASIIMWALENKEKELKQWCWLDENGDLQGDLAPYFAQAIRLEGTKRSIGRHACGWVISPLPLADLAPMIRVKPDDEDLTLGLDGVNCELIGLIKVDLLSLSTLDRLMAFQRMLETQEIN